MADFTSTGWLAGETVSAYAFTPTPPGGATGSVLASGAATSAGAVTFSGLTEGAEYVGVGGTSARRIRFRVPLPVAAQSGSTVIYGSGAPSNLVGVNGDSYVDTATSRLYGPKASGAWPGAYVTLGGGTIAPAETGFDVILVMGQSNAVGYTGATSWDYQHHDAYSPDIAQYGANGTYADIISIASDPLAHPDTGGPIGVGPAMAFSRWWARSNPGRRVLVVPYAVGGTGFASTAPNTWDSSAGTSLYTGAVAKANAAIAAAKAVAPSSKLVAFLWHQGENDAWSNWTQSQYATALDALINGVRAGVTGASATTPFILGRMVPEWVGSAGSGTSPAIDKAHADTPRRKAYTWVASGAVNAFDGANPFHFIAAGQRGNGSRLFFALTNARANTGSATIAPDAPPYVKAAQNPSAVQVDWLPAVSNATLTGYEIWRGTASGGETLLTTVSGTTLTYTDSAVSNGSTYYYKIKAVSASGTSAFSTEASALYSSQTLIASDSFNRADSASTNNASTLGTTETGAKTWTYRAGFQIRVLSNTALLAAANGTSFSAVTIDAGVPDVDVSAKLVSASSSDTCGIMVRYTDENNFVAWRIYDTTHYELVKFVGGVLTVMTLSGDGGRLNLVPVTNDVIRLVAKGTVYTVYVNAVQVGSVTDAGPSTTATNVGMRAKGGTFNAKLDDFICYTAP